MQHEPFFIFLQRNGDKEDSLISHRKHRKTQIYNLTSIYNFLLKIFKTIFIKKEKKM